MIVSLIILIVSSVISAIAFFIVTVTYRTYYSGMGLTIILSYLLTFMYTLIEILINQSDSPTVALNLSRISSIIISTSLYLLHYFHDEISAEYEQRTTMTMASIIWGMNVGIALLDKSIKIIGDPNLPVLHPLYGLLITFQAGLLIHRTTSHIIHMGKLSDHFGIQGRINPKVRQGVQKTLYGFLIVAAISYITFKDQPSTNLTILISIAALLLATLYNRDPLSSIPFTQPIEAVALIHGDNVEFLHVFEPSGESIAKHDDFGILITALIQFFTEMIKSETKIRSISTNDILVMFEDCGHGYLILVLKKRSPLIRRILKLVATEMNRNHPTNDEEFFKLINKYLLFRSINSQFVDRSID